MLQGRSFLKAVGFSANPGEVGILRIKFDDATIDFQDVPYRVFSSLVRSREPGQYYQRVIHGKFKYKKLK